MNFLMLILTLVVSRTAADLAPAVVSPSVEVGGGGAVNAASAASAAPKAAPKAARNLTAWAWANQSFHPNEGKDYVAGQGCPGGRGPTGCGCLNGNFNVPVLTQSAVSTRLVSAGSCQCTYYLPANFPATAGFTITVQNICP